MAGPADQHAAARRAQADTPAKPLPPQVYVWSDSVIDLPEEEGAAGEEQEKQAQAMEAQE